jgi:hypothetical protein
MKIKTVKELIEKIDDDVKEDIDFEDYLFSKYPDLFETDEEGKLLPQSQRCWNSCPKGWEKIVDNLFGCILDYQKNTTQVVLDPDKKFRYSLYKVWTKAKAKIDYFFCPWDKHSKLLITKEQKEKQDKTFAAKVRRLTSKIDQKIRNSQNFYINKKPRPVKVAQYKEKFGSLRFYIDGGDKNVNGMIRLAEYLSLKTCQDTGEKGKLRIIRGWYSVLSDERAKELGAKDI